MKQETNTSFNGKLSSPHGSIHTFEAELTTHNSVVTLTLVAKNTEQFTWKLNLADHNSYLDLFEKLHTKLGLRLPQNKKSAKPSTFNVNYTEVLSTNLAEGMLYGYGDPAVIKAIENGKTWYYVVSTSNDAPDSFPIVKSDNLVDWTFVGYVLPQGSKPAWAADGELISDYWAPEMHKVGNEYRVYFVARDKHTRELCIGLAVSPSPEGPFISHPEPVLSGNIIDPHIFIRNDKAYLFWKEDNNDVWPGALINLLYNNTGLLTQLFTQDEDLRTASLIITLWPWLKKLEPMERFLFTQTFIEAVTADYQVIYNKLLSITVSHPEKASEIKRVTDYMKTPMFAQPLTNDGTQLIGTQTKILENDQEWEAHLVEGMWLTQHGSKYYLFYAGNDFSTDQYGIGVAIADVPLGPYCKMEKPLLKSTEKWWAPGHPSVTTDLQGKPLMFLHAYFPGKAGYKQFRALLSVPLRFDGNIVYPEV